MARSLIQRVLGVIGFYGVALFTYALLFFLSIKSGAYFRKESEKDKNDLALARDRYWNLSNSPFPDFVHDFFTLRNGRQLHFIRNKAREQQPGNLVILIHGFPDSYVMWRTLLQEPSIPLRAATFVCVDLPGYGGSDSFEKYDTTVLEALTEFIIEMRDTFLTTDTNGVPQKNTFVVGHDWGAVLTFRLAADAPSLADRFIITNGPHVELGFANRDRILQSSAKIFKQFRQSPWQNFGCLGKSIKTLGPLFEQTMMFGYIFSFHLPVPMVKFLGTGGNLAFIRGAHTAQQRSKKPEIFVPESLACTLGPSENDCQTSTETDSNHTQRAQYGRSVLERAKSPAENFWQQTGYYRDGVASAPWKKSLETIVGLQNLDSSASESSSPARRRSSSSASSALFSQPLKGVLGAPATILWGLKDLAIGKQVCLDGIGDYLARDSEVILLPRSGHWTAIEPQSRVALARVVGMYAGGLEEQVMGKVSVTMYVNEVYEGAVQFVKK